MIVYIVHNTVYTVHQFQLAKSWKLGCCDVAGGGNAICDGFSVVLKEEGVGDPPLSIAPTPVLRQIAQLERTTCTKLSVYLLVPTAQNSAASKVNVAHRNYCKLQTRFGTKVREYP